MTFDKFRTIYGAPAKVDPKCMTNDSFKSFSVIGLYKVHSLEPLYISMQAPTLLCVLIKVVCNGSMDPPATGFQVYAGIPTIGPNVLDIM